jgi:hypothetical protein
MPSLLEVQRGMRDALLAGAGTPAWIVGGEEIAAQRLAVYRDTIAAALVRALRLAYPTVERLVGAEFFERAARQFCLIHQPTDADLHGYGAEFPGFLQSFPPCAELAYLADVARLDRAVTHALHAEDATPLDAQVLARLDAAQACALRVRFHPSVSLLRAEFPVDAIWAAVLQEDDAAMAAIDLASGPVHLLVERAGGRPVVVRMPSAEWEWTSALAQGRAFGELLTPQTVDAVAAVLAQHLAARRLVTFRTATHEGEPG